jgi:hypothetical protein
VFVPAVFSLLHGRRRRGTSEPPAPSEQPA